MKTKSENKNNKATLVNINYFSKELVNQISSNNLSKETKKELISKINFEYNEKLNKLNEEITSSLLSLNKEFTENKSEAKLKLEEELNNIEKEFANLSVEQRANSSYIKGHKNKVNGLKTEYARNLIKLNRNYEAEVNSVKFKKATLHQEKCDLIAKVKNKKITMISSVVNSYIVFKSTFNFKKTLKNKSTWLNLMPFIMIITLFIAYVIACEITGYQLNLDTIITYGIYVAVVAVGAVFIYSQGAFDMSLGAATLMAAAVAGLTYNKTDNVALALIIAISLGMALGVVNAILANFLKLPVMVMTLTMLNILNALFATIAEAQPGGYIQAPAIRQFNSVELKWSFLIIFTIIAFTLFNYTKIGRRNKMIGSNAVNAKFSGVSIMKSGIISFAISGIGLGLSGFLFTVQNGYVNTGTAMDVIGLNVIIAITIGGMPTSGGARSKISAAIIGAFFGIILDEFFAAMSIANYKYLAKGLIYLTIVLINSYESRTKMLAR